MRRSAGRGLGLGMLGTAFVLCGCSPTATTVANSGTPPKQTPAQSAAPAPSHGGQQSGGAIQNVRQAAKRVGDGNDLKNFALAYTQYALENNGQGPTNVQQIKSSLTPKMAKAFGDDGDYVVNWGLRNPSSNSILAYAKDPEVQGTRLVAKGDGTVVRMDAQEFERAKAGR